MSPDKVVVKFRDNIYITPGTEQSGFPGGKESACQCEIQIWSLDWEDTLENEMATHSSFLAWEIHGQRGTWWATVHGVAKSQKRLSNWTNM